MVQAERSLGCEPSKMGLPDMILILNARRNAPFEIGAMLDVALCYPKFSLDRQLRIANALCAKLVKGWMAAEPDRASELRAPLRNYAKASKRV